MPDHDELIDTTSQHLVLDNECRMLIRGSPPYRDLDNVCRMLISGSPAMPRRGAIWEKSWRTHNLRSLIPDLSFTNGHRKLVAMAQSPWASSHRRLDWTQILQLWMISKGSTAKICQNTSLIWCGTYRTWASSLQAMLSLMKGHSNSKRYHKGQNQLHRLCSCESKSNPLLLGAPLLLLKALCHTHLLLYILQCMDLLWSLIDVAEIPQHGVRQCFLSIPSDCTTMTEVILLKEKNCFYQM